MPDPAAYFSEGGPLFEIRPYYVTQLVTLLGPIASVMAAGASGPPTRTVESGPNLGRVIDVDVPTTVNAPHFHERRDRHTHVVPRCLAKQSSSVRDLRL